MRHLSILVAIPCLLFSRPARSEICAVDDVPAATLLLPYFEVDTVRGDGVTTLFSVTNTSPEPTLVKVTLWTDLGLPSIDFEVYLTGFDVFTSNLRDIFVAGQIPGTGPQASPVGFDSFPNAPFPGCDGDFDGILEETTRRALVNSHLGRPSLFYQGLCGASPRSDGIVRGYLTMDVVRRCALLNPTQDGYFGVDGVAAYDNRLVGDAFFVDPANGFAQGENLVRLEADESRFGPGDRTFYAPFVQGDGSDGREPLPTVWASRMIDGGGFDGGTQLTVWRGLDEPREPFDCAGNLPRLPFVQEIFSFDEEENGSLLFPNTALLDPPPPLEDLDPVPLVTNRLRRDGFPIFLPQPFGWLSMDLSTFTGDGSTADPHAQAWVGTTFSASGRFSVGLDASPLSEACSVDGCTLGRPAGVGELCVRAIPFPGVPADTVDIRPGEPLEFLLRPRGCLSSSCTRIFQLDCGVGTPEGSTVEIFSEMCLAQNRQEGVACTEDCLTDLQASCFDDDGLPAGTYTVTAGDLALTLEVPSTVPLQGLCVGEPF